MLLHICCCCCSSCVWLFATPWTVACQTHLFSTISQNLLKLMSIESIMLSCHLILFHSLLLLPSIFPSIWVFSNKLALCTGGQSSGPSASASTLPMNIQSWFPLGLIGLISLQPKELSRVFSSTTTQKNQFFGAQPTLRPNSHIPMWLLEKV